MAKIDDSTARLEQSILDATNAVNAQIVAASQEIQQVADALAQAGGPDTDGLAERLNKVADQLDAQSQTLRDSTSALGQDDPAA